MDFSVIIVTLNSLGYIKRCLDSVFSQKQKASEVIVIDNGSADNTVNFIKENYPSVRLIKNKKNLGACLARNQGISAVSSEWVLTLDCDVILSDGFFSEIEGFIKNCDKPGTIMPKILSGCGEKIYSCGIQPTWLKRFHDIGRNQGQEHFRRPFEIFGACSAAAFYRRQTLEEIKDEHGYFDERFFFLFEDADLSWRAKRQGWTSFYLPRAKCFHFGDSSKTPALNRKYLSWRNRNLTILKNQNLFVILLMSPFYLIYDLPRVIFLLIRFKFRLPKINYA